MTRADLLALAARVEAAQGADRELDAEIALACGIVRSRDGNTFYGHKHHSCVVLERGYYDHDGNAPELEHYTASLDAAASLVPLRCSWARYHNGDIEVGTPEHIIFCVTTAQSTALALTAAALRAMAEEAPA